MSNASPRKSVQARFDDSLELFVRALRAVLGDATVASGWILRDSSGRLSFIVPKELSSTEAIRAARDAVKAAGHYSAENSHVIRTLDQPGIRGLVENSLAITESVAGRRQSPITVKVIDHRIVGQDWLTIPASSWKAPNPARIVFASLKGGVGRSTAVAVAATEFARQGHKVLVVDLDLEAPGIGTMMISPKKKPKYGVLDWYVETALASMSAPEIEGDLIAPCSFADGTGLINVAPAVGARSDQFPANVLGKIARAYLEVPSSEMPAKSFLRQTQTLLTNLEAQLTYDVVLVDARAGLNETTAAAMLGLGADVLLFGVDTPQTFASYRYLLAHLAKFPRNDEDDWLYRLRMVHAHASPDSKRQAEFRDKTYAMFSDLLYRDVPLLTEKGDPIRDERGSELSIQQFSVDDPVGPHYAWPILWDSIFAEFDPFTKSAPLTHEFYMRTYSALIRGIKESILSEERA